ncbi:MAG: hypothetical protein GY821_17765 [Gammaproteobacteria bacterium]|nr:hypothetical protein [Gammaproteobacteria bacterium]
MGALFGWISFGSNKTKNAEEQDSKHIQKELSFLHSTPDQTENDITKIEIQKLHSNKDDNHIMIPGSFHDPQSSDIHNQHQDRNAKDSQTHTEHNPSN